MKKTWKELIKENREEIEETLKEALKLSYENHNRCNVLITPDGKLHIFEDASHGGETYVGECLIIASFDNQFNGVISNYFDDNEVYLECLENKLNQKQIAEYNAIVAEYEKGRKDDEMFTNERIEWICENCENAVNAIYEYVWKEFCSNLDFDEIIANALEEE